MLTDAAIEAGVRIRTNALVTEVHPDNAEVTLASGERITADVLVGADGASGATRPAVQGVGRENSRPAGVVMYE